MTDPHEHVRVTLLNFPLQVFAQVRQHQDELQREFALLALSPPKDRPGHAVPKALLDLIASLGMRYAGVGDRTDAERDAAVDRGDAAMDLHYDVPRSIAPALRELVGLLDQADEFCREGQMLTLESSDLEREFRDWFVAEFTNQVAGQPPTPWRGPLMPEI
jgi:hypothetical protein